MASKKPESFPPEPLPVPSAASTSDDLSDQELRIARIAYRRAKGEDVSDEGPLSEAEEARVARCRPARDYEEFRRWQDRHASPDVVQEFEEARRRWHERNDPQG